MAIRGNRLRALIASLLLVLLGSFTLTMCLPPRALASQVVLAWDVKNQTQDGFRVYKRAEGQMYDYTTPAWPTDGNDHTQTSCTISDLEDGVKYYFVVRAYDGSNQSGDSNEVTYMAPAPGPVTIINNNHPPEAEAGANKHVNAGDLVSLDGSGSSDPDGDKLSYTWIQKSGPTVNLIDANSVQCSFTAPDSITDTSVVIVFELNVTDTLGESSGDTCVVMVNTDQQQQWFYDDGSAIDDDTGDNSPPEQPTLMGVADGESGVSLIPLLKASGFNDANPEDFHSRTEWRIIFLTGSQQVVLDRNFDKGQLTQFRVPQLVLEPSTAYSAQVRFFDNHDQPSLWSPPVAFTTSPDENDQNQNRIPDSQEITTATDMNEDTIIDAEQDLVVKSLMTYDQEHMISVSVELNDSAVQLYAAASIDPATLAAADGMAPYSGSETPYGMLGYKIKVDQPGDVIALKFNLPEPIDPQDTQWVRYDAVDGMSNCDASTDIEESGRIVNRYLVDGGDEDADGIANGIIVELSGPQAKDSTDGTNDFNQVFSSADQSSAGGSSGGCFIGSLF